jgi:PAS domain S-box-containing protein
MMESLLREQRHEAGGAVYAAPVAILTLDNEGRVRTLNAAAESLFGCARQELIGRCWLELLPADARAAYEDLETPQFSASIFPLSLSQLPIVRSDGSILCLDATIIEVCHADSRSFAVVLREEADFAMIEAKKALLASIVDSSSDAIISQSTAGIVTSWNDAASRLFGYTATEVIGQPMFDLKIHVPEMEPYIQRVIAGERLEPLDTVACRKDGSKVEVRLTLSPVIGRNHRILGIATIARDRSEHQSLCERLEASEAVTQQLTADLDFIRHDLNAANKSALQAAKAKEEFLANMSHELRTPLNVILGFAELLCAEEDLEKAPAHRIEALATILRSGNHLLLLIDNILELSRLESGELRIQKSEVALAELAHDVMATMELSTSNRQVTLTTDIGPRVPVRVCVDQRRVKQILVHLLSNAIKFTRDGEVKLLVRRVENNGRLTSRLAFDVIDSGIGITERDLGKIFDPFSQVDNSTTRCYGGTGLGLAISQRLAKLLGGELTARSEVGAGSTFTLTIDLGPAATADVPGSLRLDAATDKVSHLALEAKLSCRILVVEDAPDNQRLVTALLRKAGATVELAENGLIGCEKAIAAKLAGSPFELILMDMQMPIMDGYEATRTLRSQDYDHPIVALTAHAMVGDREKCLSAGCDDYLSKPINREKLMEVVRAQVCMHER